jgi:hypothetical protein
MMMGERQVDQGALFYEFSLEKQVPTDHMLRSIDHFVDLGPARHEALAGAVGDKYPTVPSCWRMATPAA